MKASNGIATIVSGAKLLTQAEDCLVDIVMNIFELVCTQTSYVLHVWVNRFYL